MNKTSVIITAYNCEKFIRSSVESVICQTHQAEEIIVVDDGSTDDTVKIAKEYPVLVLTGPNVGTAQARNRGIRLSKGDFIAFLDGDDFYLPEKIERSLELFSQSDHIGVVHSGLYYFHVSKQVDVSYAEEKEYKDLLDRCWVMTNSIVRREVFDHVGLFDPSFICIEDYDLWERILREGYLIKAFREPLFVYRKHDGAKSVRRRELFDTENKIIKERIRRVLETNQNKNLVGVI